MPVIPRNKQIEIDEVSMEGEVWIIRKVEYTPEVRSNLNLIKLDIQRADGSFAEFALFDNGSNGPNTKCGAFLDALGEDTDAWPNKVVKIEKWSKASKLVVLVPSAADNIAKRRR